jgi:rubrerythrin
MTEKDFERLHGSKTEENLRKAFAGESQAHTKYAYYASVAKKEGREDFYELFNETSRNENEHAELWFKYLHDGNIPSTKVNLEDAAQGENHEHTEMYPEMAKVAREEGFMEIAAKMEMVGAIEKRHEVRYLSLLEQLDGKQAVIKEGVLVVWKCQVCGHIHMGKTAPKICPVCGHSNSFLPETVTYDWEA